MSGPQLEDGYIRIATEIYEAMIRYRIPGEQRQVLDYIIRRTYGWQKKNAEVTTKEFMDATGLKSPNVYRAIKGLVEKNLISTIKSDSKRKVTYKFNKHYKQWKSLSKTIASNFTIKNDSKSLSKTIATAIKNDSKPGFVPIIFKDNNKDNINISAFDQFWAKYPVKKGKQKAFEKWQVLAKKNQLPPIKTILDAIKNQIEEKRIKTSDNQFVPEWKYPVTWLNQQCWEDECDLETEREKWIKRGL